MKMLWQFLGLNPVNELVLDIIIVFALIASLTLVFITRRKLGVWGDIIGYKHLAVVIGRDKVARLVPLYTKDGIHYKLKGLGEPDILISPEASYPVRNTPTPMHVSIIYLPSGVGMDIEKAAAVQKMSEETGVDPSELVAGTVTEEKGEGEVETRYKYPGDKKVEIKEAVAVKLHDVRKWMMSDYNPKYIREYQSNAIAGGLDLVAGVTREIVKYMLLILIPVIILVVIVAVVL